MSALRKQLLVMNIMFSIFFMDTFGGTPARCLTAPWRLHAPKKYVDSERVGVQEEPRIRHAMKY